jgi:hypothetical protein
MSGMHLESLTIERQRWGANEGKYTGLAKFAGDAGTLGIVLSPEVTTSFLALAGDLLIAHVEVAGKALQSSIDDSVRVALATVKMPKEIAEAAANTVRLLEQVKKP